MAFYNFCHIFIYVLCFMFLYLCVREIVRIPRYRHQLEIHELGELHCRRLLRQCDSSTAITLTKMKEVRKNYIIIVLKNIYINDFVGEEELARKGGMKHSLTFFKFWICSMKFIYNSNNYE